MLQRQAEIDRQAQVFVWLELLSSMVCPQMDVVVAVEVVALVCRHNIVEAELVDKLSAVVSTLEKQFVPVWDDGKFHKELKRKEKRMKKKIISFVFRAFSSFLMLQIVRATRKKLYSILLHENELSFFSATFADFLLQLATTRKENI